MQQAGLDRFGRQARAVEEEKSRDRCGDDVVHKIGCDAANLANIAIHGNLITRFAASIYKEFYGQAAVFTGVDYACHYDCPGDTYPDGYGDKGTAHSYIEVYESLLAPMRETARSILEIGEWRTSAAR